MPKVSVIMGVYNIKNSKMAEESIFSILRQTYKDFEFIICDDGSTNDTYEVIRKLTRNDDRVKILRNERNRGLAYTLNHCLEKATGEYIARMDADDISYPDRIEKEVEFLDSHSQYALVSTCAELFKDDLVWGVRKYKECPQKKDFLFSTQILHAAMLMRKSVLEQLGGYRVAWETTRAEDYDLFMRMYSSGEKAYNLPLKLYQIREDNDAYKRRKYRFRLQEALVRYKGFKKMGLMPKGYFYVMKPLIVGLIPQPLLEKMRNERKE